jgi:hypothetical protein
MLDCFRQTSQRVAETLRPARLSRYSLWILSGQVASRSQFAPHFSLLCKAKGLIFFRPRGLRRTHNPSVPGSNPGGPTICFQRVGLSVCARTHTRHFSVLLPRLSVIGRIVTRRGVGSLRSLFHFIVDVGGELIPIRKLATDRSRCSRIGRKANSMQ